MAVDDVTYQQAVLIQAKLYRGGKERSPLTTARLHDILLHGPFFPTRQASSLVDTNLRDNKTKQRLGYIATVLGQMIDRLQYL